MQRIKGLELLEGSALRKALDECRKKGALEGKLVKIIFNRGPTYWYEDDESLGEVTDDWDFGQEQNTSVPDYYGTQELNWGDISSGCECVEKQENLKRVSEVIKIKNPCISDGFGIPKKEDAFDFVVSCFKNIMDVDAKTVIGSDDSVVIYADSCIAECVEDCGIVTKFRGSFKSELHYESLKGYVKGGGGDDPPIYICKKKPEVLESYYIENSLSDTDDHISLVSVGALSTSYVYNLVTELYDGLIMPTSFQTSGIVKEDYCLAMRFDYTSFEKDRVFINKLVFFESYVTTGCYVNAIFTNKGKVCSSVKAYLFFLDLKVFLEKGASVFSEGLSCNRVGSDCFVLGPGEDHEVRFSNRYNSVGVRHLVDGPGFPYKTFPRVDLGGWCMMFYFEVDSGGSSNVHYFIEGSVQVLFMDANDKQLLPSTELGLDETYYDVKDGDVVRFGYDVLRYPKMVVKEMEELLSCDVFYYGAYNDFFKYVEEKRRKRVLYRKKKKRKKVIKQIVSGVKKDDLVVDMVCVICLDAKRDCCFSPCHHVAVCTVCGVNLNVCPICRSVIESKFTVVFS